MPETLNPRPLAADWTTVPMLPVLLAAATVASFFAVAHVAIRSTPTEFRVASRGALLVGAFLAFVHPAAAAGVTGAVLLASRLGPQPVPATLPAWISQQR